jgi:hypothetical protein
MKKETEKIVYDIKKIAYEVAEARKTPHGFAVYFGWPEREKSWNRTPSLVVTQELVDYLKSLAYAPKYIYLPITHSMLFRIRRYAGFSNGSEARKWWEAHKSELASISLAEFAEKYNVSVTTTYNMRRKLIPGNKPGKGRGK